MDGTGKKRTGKSIGLQVSGEDLKWLEHVAENGGSAIPDFNRSRLIAMGLVEPASLALSDKGKGLLRSRGKAADSRGA